MACKIKIRGEVKTQAELQAIMAVLGGNIDFRNSIMYDAYIDMTKNEREISTDAIKFLKDNFNMNTEADVVAAIQSERNRLESIGLLKNDDEIRRSIKINGFKETLSKIGAWGKDQLSNLGHLRYFGKEGKKLNEKRIRNQGELNSWMTAANRKVEAFNAVIESLSKYLDETDKLALSNVLNTDKKGPITRNDFSSVPFVKLLKDTAKKNEVIDKLIPVLQGFRDYMDKGSKVLASIPGLVTELQKQLVLDNTGKYSTIVYEAHRNPNWAKAFEKDKSGAFKGGSVYQAVFESALPYVKKMLSKDLKNYIKLRNKKAKAITTFKSKGALSLAETSFLNKLEDDVKVLNNMINRNTLILADKELIHTEVLAMLEGKNEGASLTNALTPSGKRGAIGTTILKKRKNIPNEVKALLGEIRDPEAVFLTTIAKVMSAVTSAQYQHNMADTNDALLANYTMAAAMGRAQNEIPPLFSILPIPEAGVVKKITLPKTGSFNILANRIGTYEIYVLPEVEEFFTEESQVLHTGGYALLHTLNTASKINATVLSFPTQERNFISNFGKLITSLIADPKRGDIAKQFGSSIYQRSRNEFYQIAGGIQKALKIRNGIVAPDYSSEFERLEHVMRQQGLHNSDIVIADLNKELQDGNTLTSYLESAASGYKLTDLFKNVAKGTLKTASRWYAAGDNIFKESLFIGELNKYSDAYFNMSYKDLLAKGTPEQIQKVEDISGEIIRNTMPNYNESYKLMKTIQNTGVGLYIAPFAIFRLEQFRTMSENIQLIGREIKNNDVDPQVRAKLRKIGYRRLMSTLALGAISTTMLYSKINGLDDDEEEFVLEYINPEHVETPWITKDYDGNIEIVDLASVNIYGSFGLVDKNIGMMFSDDPDAVSKGFVNIILGLVGPVAAPQIGTSSLINTIKGEDRYGKPLYSPNDSFMMKAAKILGAFSYDVGAPGTVKAINRLHEKQRQIIELDNQIDKLVYDNAPDRVIENVSRAKYLAEEDLQRENYSFFPGIREYIFNPEVKLPVKIYDIKEKINNLSKDYKIRIDKVDPSTRTDEDRDRVYEEMTTIYNKDLDALRRYVEKAASAGYDVVPLLEDNIVAKGETLPEENDSVFSKKILKYISGETDEKPDLVIKLYDGFLNIKRDKDGNIK